MFACCVMIDVNGELIGETLYARPFDVRAFDDKYGIVFAIDLDNLPDLVRTRKRAIGNRYLISRDDLSRLIQRTQQPAQSERLSDAITIGPDVRGDRKALLIFN